VAKETAAAAAALQEKGIYGYKEIVVFGAKIYAIKLLVQR
jgi:hypothetical protein